MHMLKIVSLPVQIGCFWAAFRRSWLCESGPYWLASTWDYLSSALCVVGFVVVLDEWQFQEKTEKILTRLQLPSFILKSLPPEIKDHYSQCVVIGSVLSCHLSSGYFHLFKRPRQEGSEMAVVLNWAYRSCEGFTVCLPKRQPNYSEKAITFLKIKEPFDRDVV